MNEDATVMSERGVVARHGAADRYRTASWKCGILHVALVDISYPCDDACGLFYVYHNCLILIVSD